MMAAWSVRLAVAAILLESAQHAFADRHAFAAVIGAYRILPLSWSNAAAMVLPVLQIAVAGGLMSPRTTLAAACLGLSLLLAFTFAMAVNLRRGRSDIDCGCGGDSQRISLPLVIRNLVLMAGLAGTLAAPVHAHFSAAVTVGVAGFGVFLTGLYFAANQLLSNAQAFAADPKGASA